LVCKVFFEECVWGPVTERTVQAVAIKEMSVWEQLVLEGSKEAFSKGVVVAVSLGAHALEEADSGQQPASPSGGVLTASVGMEESSLGEQARVLGLLEGSSDELRMHGSGEFPSNDATAEKIDDDGEVEPSLAGGDVGDVADDLDAGAGGLSGVFEEIGRGSGPMVGLSGARPEGLSRPCLQACGAHEAGDAVLRTGLSEGVKGVGHSGTAVAAGVSVRMDCFHLKKECLVFTGAWADRAFSGDMVSGA
jgi:hypothetical protein